MNVLIDVFSYKLSFLTDLLRYLFLFLDGLIYNLIQPLYAAALNLADIREVLHQDQLVELITSRIYIFLGLFMFFKLAFSIISMIANPDMVNDKQKGLSKIVTNVIITLILLVIMPSVFRMAYGLQDTVINGGYLRGIFGTTHDGKMATGNEGVELGKKVFRIFINPINDNGTTQNAINLFEKPTDRVDVGVLNTHDAMTRDTKGIYDISYMMVISTIVGVMMVISFLKIGVEIALRSLKLLVLEIISPIAVISYLDPASATKGLFAKWSSLAIKTYLSLFLRLGMVYFITSMLSGINIEDFGKGLGALPSIILILALLAFMQSAPKMLEELFGYKPGEDSKAIKGIVNGALGFGVGATTAAIGVTKQLGGFAASKIMGNKPPGKIRQALHKASDVGSATLGGVKDVFSSGAAGFKSGAKSGALSARNTPKDTNYKQAQQKKEKAMNEKWAKQQEFDQTLSRGKKELEKQNDFIKDYSYNSANYAGDATYAALYSAATSPTATAAQIKQFEDYAKPNATKQYNLNTFSSPISVKKNTIIDLEESISINTSAKIQNQARLDSVISRGFAPGDVEYDTALTDLMNVNSLIAKDTETLEKTKGGLDMLLKSPAYSNDALIDQGIKLAKNVK